jgi:hypothetical protein
MVRIVLTFYKGAVPNQYLNVAIANGRTNPSPIPARFSPAKAAEDLE